MQRSLQALVLFSLVAVGVILMLRQPPPPQVKLEDIGPRPSERTQTQRHGNSDSVSRVTPSAAAPVGPPSDATPVLELPTTRPPEIEPAEAELAAGQSDSRAERKTPIRLKLTGASSTGGELRIAVFRAADGFPQYQHAVLVHRVAEPTEAAVELELPAMKGGPLAIAVYQDTDGNEELSKGRFGIPREPYGFSNNVRGMMGPPKFSAAKFEHDAQVGTTLKIKLK